MSVSYSYCWYPHMSPVGTILFSLSSLPPRERLHNTLPQWKTIQDLCVTHTKSKTFSVSRSPSLNAGGHSLRTPARCLVHVQIPGCPPAHALAYTLTCLSAHRSRTDLGPRHPGEVQFTPRILQRTSFSL